MKYTELTEKELDEVVKKYIEYYNTVEDCCFTYEKAYKRIHQVMTIEDAMCQIQYDDNGNMTGFCMGYYKQFDDLLAYFETKPDVRFIAFDEYKELVGASQEEKLVDFFVRLGLKTKIGIIENQIDYYLVLRHQK